MRIWSLHPKYLDAKGIVALWREGLLAIKVIARQTVGYREHPQLIRFKEHACPLDAINFYLWGVYLESVTRGYSFDVSKIKKPKGKVQVIDLPLGQLRYELKHLQDKLTIRDPKKFLIIKKLNIVEPHPLFRTVPGPIANWEKINRISS